MNIRFRDLFTQIQEGKDQDGNQIIMFSDSSCISDRELSLLGLSDESPIFGVKTVFARRVRPKALADSQNDSPEYVEGEEITISGVPRKAAENAFKALIR